MRASNARPYGVVGSAGYVVGATIGRPLLRLSRKSVTATLHFNPLPLSAAHWLNASCPCAKGGGLSKAKAGGIVCYGLLRTNDPSVSYR